MDAEKLKYYLALNYCKGIGPIKFHAIKEKHPDLKQLFKSSIHEPFRNSLNNNLVNSLKSVDWKLIERLLEWESQSNINHILTIDCKNYPILLTELPDAPPILFIKGNPAYLNNKQIAVIGSRKPSHQGAINAQSFTQGLLEFGYTITSGLAYGIDIISHQTCLNNNSITIAVLGSGLECIYPYQHHIIAETIIQNGALVSEYPPHEKPKAQHFPKRNRIICGLSHGVLVVEATLQSGSLITANLALDYNREVFAIPGSIHNTLTKGCHSLIKQGAKLVDNINDIISELPDYKKTDQPTHPAINNVTNKLPQQYQTILAVLDDMSIPIDILADQLDLPINKLSSILLELELQGLISPGPNGYQRCFQK